MKNTVSKTSYVAHGDLLGLAQRRNCHGIHSEPVITLCRPDKNFWLFKAIVYKSSKCRGFVGYGDAHPGNVSPLIFNHAEMRMAETRAVNRALRKAYGIALCSLEELPPEALGSQQLAGLRRSSQSKSLLQKGGQDASKNSRSQSSQRTSASRRRIISGESGPVRIRRPQR